MVLVKGSVPVKIQAKGDKVKIMNLSSLRIGQIGTFPMGCVTND